MRQKIIGTGLTGLVGSRITELLHDKFDFENIDLKTGVDITKIRGLENKVGNSRARILLHLAAFTDVNAAWQEKGNKNGLCYRVNVIGTRNIVKLCAKYKKFLIHFSTDFVFDGTKKTPYTEQDKQKPIEWYGQTKYWAEKEVKNYSNNFCILRIAFPYRACYEPKLDLVRGIIKGFKDQTLYPMFTDQITTPTFIDDIAYGLKKVIEAKPKGIYHLVASSFQSPYNLAVEIAKLFGFNKDLVKKGSLQEYRKSQPSSSRPWQKFLGLSNRKIKDTLGIKMGTIDQALRVIKKQMGTSLSD